MKKTAVFSLVLFILLLGQTVQSGAAQVQKEEFVPEEMTSFLLQVPEGVKGNGLVVGGSNLSAYLFFETYSDENMDVTLKLELPKGFVLQGTPVHSFSLQTEYEDWYRSINFYVPPDLPSGTYNITATAVVEVKGEKHTLVRKTQLKIASREEIAGEISVSGLAVPSDENGYGNPSYPPNTVVIQENSQALKKLLKFTDLQLKTEDIRSTCMGIKVSNTGNDTVPVIITYDILDIKTGKPVKAFKPDIMGMRTETLCYATLTLAPNSSSLISLPVFISEEAMGGDYLLRVKVKITGSDWVAAEREEKITAISRNWGPIIITLISAFLGVVATGLFFSRSKEIMDRFKTRNLVLIALFGTVSFAAINLPMTILWELSHAVFGPFSFLFTGLFHEVILYMLIASLVVLIPKPGVISLFMIVRFLLGGFITGSFTPIFFITFSINAIILEALMYAAGITRSTRAGKTHSPNSSRLRMGIVCGISDVISGYTSFNVWMILYRLFYSDWYIAANLLIDGFLYTFIGAWFGISLGNRLKKVVE